MKKCLLAIIFILTTYTVHAEEIIDLTREHRGTSGIYFMVDIGAVPDFEVSGENYTFDSSNLGTGLGMSVIAGYRSDLNFAIEGVIEVIQYDNSTDDSNTHYKSTATLFKLYGLYQPYFGNYRYAIMPYAGFGISYATLENVSPKKLTTSYDTIYYSSYSTTEEATGFGFAVKAGARAKLLGFLIDLNAEYDNLFTTNGNGKSVDANNVTINLGLGFMF